MREPATGILTYAYSDDRSESFSNGVMRISNGKKTDRKISSVDGKVEGVDYYVKPDPDFENGLYGVCHHDIRERIAEDEYLFFRTLWRGNSYLLGYFRVGSKIETPNGPLLVARDISLKNYEVPITEDIVKEVNPSANGEAKACRSFNEWINYNMGYRSYLKLDEEKTSFLRSLLE